jgi:hypothetical protein
MHPRAGKGRGVTAGEDVSPGRLLLVSEPVCNSVLGGPVGLQLAPDALLQHWRRASKQQGLSMADRCVVPCCNRSCCGSRAAAGSPAAVLRQRHCLCIIITFVCVLPCHGAAHRYRLSLLQPLGSTQPPPTVTFKDFSPDKASSKAKKAAAGAKGFGAGGSKPAGGAGSATAAPAAAAAAAAAAELTQEQTAAVLAGNAYAAPHIDSVLAMCRQQALQSVIGARMCVRTWMLVCGWCWQALPVPPLHA